MLGHVIRAHSGSLGLARAHSRFHSDSLGLARACSGFTRTHSDSLGHSRASLGSLRLTQAHSGPLGLNSGSSLGLTRAGCFAVSRIPWLYPVSIPRILHRVFRITVFRISTYPIAYSISYLLYLSLWHSLYTRTCSSGIALPQLISTSFICIVIPAILL